MSGEAPDPESASPDAAPQLHCLGGAPAPEPFVAHWRAYQALPASCQASIWSVLGPMLVSGPTEEVARVSTAFAEEHRVAPADLERAVDACHFLLTQAASLALDEASFRADLATLTPDGGPGVDALLSEFGEVSAFLRRRVVEGSILDHSRVLLGLDWRIDVVGASQRGLRIDQPVGVLTLKHQQGFGDDAETGRITLHVLPEGLAALKQACEQLEHMLASTKPS